MGAPLFIDESVHFVESSNMLAVFTNDINGSFTKNYIPQNDTAGAIQSAQSRIKDTYPVLYWGGNNFFPNQCVLLGSRHPFLGGILKKQRAIVLGTRKYEVYEKIYENGKANKFFVGGGAIQDFLDSIKYKEVINALVEDLVWHDNAFLEVTRKNSGDIAEIQALDVTNCRLSENQKSVFVYPTWYDIIPHTNYEEIPFYDKSKRQKKFVIHIKDVYSGSIGYGINPIWNCGDWIKFAIKLAVFKNASIDRSAVIRYIVRIPLNYFETVYPDGAVDKDGKLIENIGAYRAKKRTELLENIDKTLTNATDTNKSVSTYSYFDPVAQRWVEGIEIVHIKDETNYEAFVGDNELATRLVVSASGFSPSIAGIQLASGLGSSGSDIRNQYNLALLACLGWQDLICEAMRLILGIKFPSKQYFFDIPTFQMVTADVSHNGIAPNEPKN